MCHPKYDLPLSIGVSLVVSLIATYVATKYSVNPEWFVEGPQPSPSEVVDCVLDDNGTTTTCYEFVTVSAPVPESTTVPCSLDYDDTGEPSGGMPPRNGEFIADSPSIRKPASI